MPRYALIDKETGKVLNVIEADEEFIKSAEILGVTDNGEVITKDKVNIVISDVASVGDLIIDSVVYRVAGNL